MADQHDRPEETDTPKKRLKLGRKWEKERDQRLQSHTMGPPCGCKRLKCFETTSIEERTSLLDHFNSLAYKDAQDSLLSTMIKVQTVSRRRPRQGEEQAKLHEHSYCYNIKVVRDGKACEVPICITALCSVFGIGKSRIERIRSSLALTGLPPQSKQGKHANRPLAFSEDTIRAIMDHIRSFRGRQSHYSLKDSRKLYLPEDLNLTKMYGMFKDKFPNMKVSRESYRKVFTEKFNVSFGYPRKDTCSGCDRFSARLKEADLSAEEIHKIGQEKQLHLRKADTFYERKRGAKEAAQANVHQSAVAFDYAKNLSCPNLTTNDVYYRRQLSLYTFNIHRLEDDNVHLYCYDETVGKKGADDVTSMLSHYFMEVLSPQVTELKLFCDNCAGQNKNWTLLRFLHDLVVGKKRFRKITLSFPIRGHSYLECDRDMAAVNQQARVETPEGWMEEFRTCRKKPSPFNVVRMQRDMFYNMTEHLKVLYKTTCPVPVRPLREIVFSEQHPRLFHYREMWNGLYSTAIIKKPVGPRTSSKQVALTPVYKDRLPISHAKFADLQVLSDFCSPEAKDLFSDLPHAGQAKDNLVDSESESEQSS